MAINSFLRNYNYIIYNMSPYLIFSWAIMLLDLEESKIFAIDSVSGYSEFYYYTSYYFNNIFKGPAAHNAQKWLAILHSICRHIFLVIGIHFIRKKGMQLRTLLFHFFPLLNSITKTSHFKSCSWADAALEIGAHLELSVLSYKLM